MIPITTTRNKAVLEAITGHRPNNQQACLCGETPWTATHLKQRILDAAPGAAVNTATGAQWEISEP